MREELTSRQNGTLVYWFAWRPILTVDWHFAWLRYVLRDTSGFFYD